MLGSTSDFQISCVIVLGIEIDYDSVLFFPNSVDTFLTLLFFSIDKQKLPFYCKRNLNLLYFSFSAVHSCNPLL